MLVVVVCLLTVMCYWLLADVYRCFCVLLVVCCLLIVVYCLLFVVC